MTDESVEELLPEWTSFWDAVQQRGFTEGTARVAWTVRELVAHQAGNAAELATVLAAFVEDRPVPATRSFEEREPLVGDDETSREQLAQPWLTSHSVLSVGLPLLQKGAARLDPNEPFLARLRVNGHDDVVISGPAFPHIELRSIEGRQRWKPTSRPR